MDGGTGGMNGNTENPIRRLASASSEATVCQIGVDLLERFLESRVSILSKTGAEHVAQVATNAAGPVDPIGTRAVSEEVLWHVADGCEPRIVDDLARTRSTAATAGDGSKRHRSGLFVPIEGYGAIVAFDEDPGTFDEGDLRAAELVADVLAPFLVDGWSTEEGTPAANRLVEIAKLLSHDLGTPIQIARSWVEHAIDTGETDRLEDALDAIDRVDELTSSIEAYARTGRPLAEPEVVDLETIAEAAWPVVDGTEAELEVVGTVSFLADESRLRELFENLFANAVVHGPSPVTVRVGPLDDRAGFYVEDDGRGIPPSKREAVLEYGYSTETDRSGYGLGIVVGIVEAHGWEIEVGESDDGGARFETSGVELA